MEFNFHFHLLKRLHLESVKPKLVKKIVEPKFAWSLSFKDPLSKIADASFVITQAWLKSEKIQACGKSLLSLFQ